MKPPQPQRHRGGSGEAGRRRQTQGCIFTLKAHHAGHAHWTKTVKNAGLVQGCVHGIAYCMSKTYQLSDARLVCKLAARGPRSWRTLSLLHTRHWDHP